MKQIGNSAKDENMMIFNESNAQTKTVPLVSGIPYVTKAPTSIEPKSGQLPHNIYMLEGVVVTGTHKILERQKE